MCSSDLNITVTFTSSNFSVAQEISVRGVDDSDNDSAVSYTVFLMPAQSSDSRYNGLDPQDLGFVNEDDD